MYLIQDPRRGAAGGNVANLGGHGERPWRAAQYRCRLRHLHALDRARPARNPIAT